VTKVNEGNIARILVRKISLPEEAIVKCYRGTFVDESDAFKTSYFSSIQNTLSLNIVEI
jgi:hypothetical protein